MRQLKIQNKDIPPKKLQVFCFDCKLHARKVTRRKTLPVKAPCAGKNFLSNSPMKSSSSSGESSSDSCCCIVPWALS